MGMVEMYDSLEKRNYYVIVIFELERVEKDT